MGQIRRCNATTTSDGKLRARSWGEFGIDPETAKADDGRDRILRIGDF